jgi:hypothetical protein
MEAARTFCGAVNIYYLNSEQKAEPSQAEIASLRSQ